MKAGNAEAWEPRKVIIDGEEIDSPERITVRLIDDVGDPEGAQRCGWLMVAVSSGWEGCEKWSFLDSVPEEYREEAEHFYEIARWDREEQVA